MPRAPSLLGCPRHPLVRPYPSLMRRLAALAVPALLLAGCSAPAAAPPAGVAVSVQQNRSDVAAGRMQIRVENAGPDKLRLTRAVVTDERFDSPAVWEGDTTLAPGAARMLPAPLPDASCATDAGSPTVELTFSTPDAAGTAAVAAADPFDMMATVPARSARPPRYSRPQTSA